MGSENVESEKGMNRPFLSQDGKVNLSERTVQRLAHELLSHHHRRSQYDLFMISRSCNTSTKICGK